MFNSKIIKPIPTVAGYIGGKRLLAKRLAERINAVPHDLYAEVFMGMGGVFFKRTSAPKTEVINDVSKDVATFFRCLQNHYQALLDMLKWQLSSRNEFERLMGQDPDTLTDLQRSVRFLYLQRLTFGGKVAGRTFGVDTTSPARFDIQRLIPLLEAAHERLSGVWIECKPWQAFIKQWDREHSLFFLDPPYWGFENYYGKDKFDRSQFSEISETLKGLRGRFIMTLNDVPEVRELFDWADIEPVELTYSVGGVNGKKVKELIISSPKSTDTTY